jgi:ribonucleoside-diphosphate reductase alpha chain
MSTGVCNLGSLNLTQFISYNDKIPTFDYNKFEDRIYYAVRYLDEINNISEVPSHEYKQSMIEKRRIGLGVMGLGSLHFILGIPYGSDESIELVDKIYKIKAQTEILASSLLGKEKGSFVLFDKNKYFNSYWWKNLEIDSNIKKVVENLGEMRNSHRSMNAPNGNSSIYANVVSGGIEPVFSKEYYRYSIVSGDELNEFNSKYIIPNVLKGELFETNEFKFKKMGDEKILEGEINGIIYQIDKNRGLTKRTLIEDYGWKIAKTLYNEDELNDSNRFKSTFDMDVNDHISILKVISKWTDQSNSKTINLKSDYSFEDFKNVYLDAYKSNIKGVTTYREGTMTAVLQKKEDIKEYQNDLDKLIEESNGHVLKDEVKLPSEYYSKGYIIRDRNKKKWYINIAFADSKYKKPFALFINTNARESNEVTDELIEKIECLCKEKGVDIKLIEKQKEKYKGQTNVVKIARAIGMALRHNIPIIEIVNVLDNYTVEISSLLFHLGKLLAKFIKNGTKIKHETCPICGKESIIYQESCKMCSSCAWSKC